MGCPNARGPLVDSNGTNVHIQERSIQLLILSIQDVPNSKLENYLHDLYFPFIFWEEFRLVEQKQTQLRRTMQTPTIACSVINRDVSNHHCFNHPLWGTWMGRQAQQSCALFISSLYKADAISYIVFGWKHTARKWNFQPRSVWDQELQMLDHHQFRELRSGWEPDSPSFTTRTRKGSHKEPMPLLMFLPETWARLLKRTPVSHCSACCPTTCQNLTAFSLRNFLVLRFVVAALFMSVNISQYFSGASEASRF